MIVGALCSAFLHLVLLAFSAGEFFGVGTVLCITGCLAAALASIHWMLATPPRHDSQTRLTCGI